jgi:hypothetical protein
MPKEIARKRAEFLAMALELTRKRIAQKESGHSFFSYMLSVDNPRSTGLCMALVEVFFQMDYLYREYLFHGLNVHGGKND